MEITTEDKERIEQEAKNARLGYSVVTKWFEAGAEYATIYEREQQVPQMMYANDTILKQATYIRELEAKRIEVRNKVIDEVLLIVSEWGKQIDPNYIEGQQLFHKLNSLKTK